MLITRTIKKILGYYESDSPGTLVNLARILTHGRLGNSGKLLILPVDQGFEHGPERSFSLYPEAKNPLYHYQLAVDAGLSAFAAPLGLLEAGARTYAGAIPTILKMNSGTLLSRFSQEKLLSDQAITGSVDEALRLGCVAVGLTIYPGSDQTYGMFEDVREVVQEAKAKGLAAIVWAYPRGNMSQAGETALDVISYAAHISALLGAHIIKVKLPTSHIEDHETAGLYHKTKVDGTTQTARVAHIMQAAFAGRRLVVFSGGAHQDITQVYEQARSIYEGGGHGFIIGRNTFQRPRAEALKMLKRLTDIFRGRSSEPLVKEV